MGRNTRKNILSFLTYLHKHNLQIDKVLMMFYSHIEQGKECWEWKGDTVNGYGRFYIKGRRFVASRVSYEIHKGIIPYDGLVLHKCDNPNCINPDHLIVGTHEENLLDCKLKNRKRHPLRKNTFLGITWRKDTQKWRAYIQIGCKRLWLGCFEDEIIAAEARDQKMIALNIPGILNFPSKYEKYTCKK